MHPSYIKKTFSYPFRVYIAAATSFLCVFFFSMVLIHNLSQARYARRIAEEVLRFHVIANSNTPADQALKFEVRDALITYMAGYSDSFNNANEAAAFASSHCDELTALANSVIQDAGFSYDVTTTVTLCDFPKKTYGNLTFPAGKYQALRVQIGEAKGQNWWCVLYPVLCFTKEGTAAIPEESQSKLAEVLSEEDYQKLQSQVDRPIIRFRLFEWVKQLLQ